MIITFCFQSMFSWKNFKTSIFVYSTINHAFYLDQCWMFNSVDNAKKYLRKETRFQNNYIVHTPLFETVYFYVITVLYFLFQFLPCRSYSSEHVVIFSWLSLEFSHYCFWYNWFTEIPSGWQVLPIKHWRVCKTQI